MIKEKSRGRDWRYLLMEICILESIRVVVLKGMDNIIGRMDLIIEDNFCQE